MKVLFLTYAYPPQRYPRSIQISHLVQYLKNENSIKIITYPVDFVKTNDKSLLEFTPLDNVIYTEESYFTQMIERSRGHIVKTNILPDEHYFWHFDLYKKAKSTIDSFNPEVIVTFGQPMSTHIAGLKLKKTFPQLKWIAHFSDPWLTNPFHKYNAWTKLINSYYENNVFKNADGLVFTSQETIKSALAGYPHSITSKTFCLPHCFNPSLYTKKSLKKEKVFTVRYLGNFYGERQPYSFLKALKDVPKYKLKNIIIEFVGAISLQTKSLIASYGLQDKIFCRPSVSYLDSLQLMKESSLLLIIDAPFENSPFLPSKLIDYIGSGTPLFGIVPLGTSQKLIQEMGFLTAHPNNHLDIAKFFLQAIDQINEKKQANIPLYIRERYSVEKIGSQMKDILKK